MKYFFVYKVSNMSTSTFLTFEALNSQPLILIGDFATLILTGRAILQHEISNLGDYSVHG